MLSHKRERHNGKTRSKYPLFPPPICPGSRYQAYACMLSSWPVPFKSFSNPSATFRTVRICFICSRSFLLFAKACAVLTEFLIYITHERQHLASAQYQKREDHTCLPLRCFFANHSISSWLKTSGASSPYLTRTISKNIFQIFTFALNVNSLYRRAT